MLAFGNTRQHIAHAARYVVRYAGFDNQKWFTSKKVFRDAKLCVRVAMINWRIDGVF